LVNPWENKMNSKTVGLSVVFTLLLCEALVSCRRASNVSNNAPAPFVFETKVDYPITLLSTQLNPVEEAGKMRNVILKGFPGSVEFRPNDSSYVFSSIDSIIRNDPKISLLLGALHGDLLTLYERGALLPMDSVFAELQRNGLVDSFSALGKFDGTHIYYVPWMQATFVMVANRKALPYLPKGADLNNLTYAEYLQWGKNIYEGTKRKMIGFPAGEKGLMHRFFQGYLYPSFTGNTLLRYRSPEARDMWEYFRNLWQYVYPGSLVYSSMADPLIIEDGWIGWDHTARLVKVFEERSQDFVTFPAPIGPRGRGFMTIVSGLAIPKDIQKPEKVVPLIDYLTRPEVQILALRETGFFPVVSLPSQGQIPENFKMLYSAVQEQAGSPRSVLTLAPVGLGNKSKDFNDLYMLTFSEIILDKKDIQTVLDGNAKELQAIIDDRDAKCWLPDISQERPCKIE
jgi:multiple sugar transport system substrate-binding protein